MTPPQPIGTPLPFRMAYISPAAPGPALADLGAYRILCQLRDFRPTDANAFHSAARLRMACKDGLIILSPSFNGFSFTAFWAPDLAGCSDEVIETGGEGYPLPLDFYLLDARFTVRGIRRALISSTAAATIRGWQERLLRSRRHTSAALTARALAIQANNPQGLPDTAFEMCVNIGR